MNTKKTLQLLFAFLFALMCTSQSAFAQAGNNQAVPYKFIFPMAYPQDNYGIENMVVMQYGPFDNTQISDYPGFCETTIAANPSDPMNFVCTDNRITGYSGPKYVYYTTDGGVSWGETVNGIIGNQGDPVLAFDGQNNCYLCVLKYGPMCFKSIDKGATWTNIGYVVNNSNADKEWIAADQTQGTYKNNVYVAYVNFSAGARVDFWRSTDNGQTWSGPIGLGYGTPNPGPNVKVDKDGRVYVAWYASSGADVAISNDGGLTFPNTSWASSYSTPGYMCARYSVKDCIRLSGFPMMKVDMTNGPYANNVYLAYCFKPGGGDVADIGLVSSSDHGITWSNPVRVCWDDNTINDNWMTDCAVDKLGRVWVYWWDSRVDPNNDTTAAWAAYSTDGGQTFSPNFQVGNQYFDPNAIRIYQGNQHYYLGDYQSMDANASGDIIVFPCWIGNGNSTNDFTAYLPDYGVSFLYPIDSIGPGQVGANNIEIPMMGPYSGTVTYSASVTPPPSSGTITFTFSPGNVKTLSGSPDSLIINTTVSGNIDTTTTYTVTVTGTESSGPRSHNRSFTLVTKPPIGIRQKGQTAFQFALRQNYPNPFNPTTTIDYSIAKRSMVSLKVYDILGRQVAVLINNMVKAQGSYRETFDASKLASGVYYYRITAGDFTDVKKMILIK